MRRNAIIKAVAYYHPDNVIENDFYIEHFKRKKQDIEGLLKSTGRKTRYIADDLEETIIQMGVLAAKRVLEKAHVKATDLDMIVFSSGTPEYISPTNALIVHDHLGAKQKCGVYDINTNCAGMLVALDQISRSVQSNSELKYVLLVGSDQLNRFSRYDEAITYSNFGDSACAVLLEGITDTERGLVGSDYYTNSSTYNRILFPAKGLSNVIRDRSLSTQDKLLQWDNFDFDGAFNSAHISIEDLLFRHNMKKQDIKKYCISQFSIGKIQEICADLDEDIDKFVFVGDEFGYTGTTSPLLAYARAVENGELEIGDNVVFWTLGAGLTCVSLLYRY